MRNINICIIVLCVFFSCKEKQKEPITIQEVKANVVSGKLMRIDSFPTDLIESRTVDIWIPKNYNDQNKYNVLYMNDGQMLFDSINTWNKQEWGVDEAMDKLLAENKIEPTIVVGIYNIPELRHEDYFPEKVYEVLPEKIKDSLKIPDGSPIGTDNCSYIDVR